jgi:hypothetical protein
MVMPRIVHSKRKRQSIGGRPWYDKDVYYHQEHLGLQKVGGLLAGSKGVITSKVTGAEPVGVGKPNDGLLGAPAIAAFLNELFGFSAHP